MILGVIPARGGSKRLPGKHLLPLGGRPVIRWTIEAALQSKALSRLVVSTNDPAVAECARDADVEVLDRPDHLAGDFVPDLPVMWHALLWAASQGREPAALVWLRPTYPFRTHEDIRAAILLWTESGATAVRGVTRARHHPWKCYRETPDGLVPYVRHEDREAAGPDLGGHALDPVWAAAGAVDVLSATTVLGGSTEGSRCVPYILPPERALDLDTAYDYEVAGALALATRTLTVAS